jgi:hypothetical protein
MEIIGAIFVLFLFSIPILAIFLLLLVIALKLLSWLCLGLAKLIEAFVGKEPKSITPVDARGNNESYAIQMYE